MPQVIDIVLNIPIELDQYRLDQALALQCPHYSRSQIQRWIKEGEVEVAGQIQLKPRIKVSVGQQVVIHAVVAEKENWGAQPIALKVIYEDADLIIIDKPAGLVVHPGAGNPNGTLVNALIHHDPQLLTLPRAGVIHRLDKNTSGLLVVARNPATHFALVKAMQERKIKREYIALVEGAMIAGGVIKTYFGRDPHHRTKMSVLPFGKLAITHYRIQKRFLKHTLVQVELETGRTHQIRVHLAYIRYPVVGDPEYGKKSLWIDRQALHAERLTLTHPRTQEILTWQSAIPEDFKQLIDRLSHE